MYYILFFLFTFLSIYGAVSLLSIAFRSLSVRTDKKGVKIYEKSERGKDRRWIQF
jgi:hypothetical protein